MSTTHAKQSKSNSSEVGFANRGGVNPSKPREAKDSELNKGSSTKTQLQRLRTADELNKGLLTGIQSQPQEAHESGSQRTSSDSVSGAPEVATFGANLKKTPCEADSDSDEEEKIQRARIAAEQEEAALNLVEKKLLVEQKPKMDRILRKMNKYHSFLDAFYQERKKHRKFLEQQGKNCEVLNDFKYFDNVLASIENAIGDLNQWTDTIGEFAKEVEETEDE